MAVYTVVRQAPVYRQMTIEEFLFGKDTKNLMLRSNVTNTRTYVSERANERLLNEIDIGKMINSLESFSRSVEYLKNQRRESLYNTFYQPKRNKGISCVFNEVFKTQKNFISCNPKAVCHLIADALSPYLRQHPTDKDEEIFSTVQSRIISDLSKSGFDTSNIDLSKCIHAGFRRIDAPTYALKAALSELKGLLEEGFGALYHTSAFAYIKGRSTLKAMKRHQSNESKWFLKLDFSNFFGSTTLDFVMKMVSMIFPFSEIVKTAEGRHELEAALELGFLNEVLPQGTPLSPTLTNIMMIPIDHQINKGLKNFKTRGKEGEKTQSFVYTRYSDDLIISSKYDFTPRDVETFIMSVLRQFDAPFTINQAKTRYGSSSGSNWNLGTMLNKDNNITVGFRNKRSMKSALHNYALDKKNGKDWEIADVQRLAGRMSYYRMIEGDTINQMVDHLSKKLNMDICATIKQDLSV